MEKLLLNYIIVAVRSIYYKTRQTLLRHACTLQLDKGHLLGHLV